MAKFGQVWQRLSFSRRIQIAGVGMSLLAVMSLLLAVFLYRDSAVEFWKGFLTNAGTELLSIAITILVLNELYQRAQEEQSTEQLKRQLIREVGSSIRDVAVPAVEQLKTHGWGFRKLDELDESLVGASLGHANLQGARLSHANLQGAKLMRAKLQAADLMRAKLQGANLAHANLEEADLTLALYNDDTVWPDGFDSKAAGAINEDEEQEPWILRLSS